MKEKKKKKREVWKYSEANVLHNLTSVNIQRCELNKGTGNLFQYVSDADTWSGFNVMYLSPQSNSLRNIQMTENSGRAKMQSQLKLQPFNTRLCRGERDDVSLPEPRGQSGCRKAAGEVSPRTRRDQHRWPWHLVANAATSL